MSRGRGAGSQAAWEVALFVPNIIGYMRLVLLLAAAFTADNFLWFMLLYGASQLLDIADGHAARTLQQVSVFGACFDQLVDRLSTCLLYTLNAIAYPRYGGGFFLLLLTDMGGHWLHFFAATAVGASSHKRVDEAPWILQQYYTRKGPDYCFSSFHTLVTNALQGWYGAWRLACLPCPAASS
ncbi:probable CDP-diacylglycerol--inositol 3-phosphatidyltransferase 2 [Cyclospora cayetanensis]|uniref:Probable CDP-diacylglycerol--inositol 3-phosphatidyltransferase 2 n=1 Tax=Cyclospora cayetanensis TaxID=88456 RepID=A0A6P6RYK4_9EIME|nr:probable CDP-diacylglycerol--inositol 3-phosphatidyltransferase 2 [Cyclospora cayetanensis]